MSKLLIGDVREVVPTLESESVQMCVTSPPYWGLRDYGVDGQLGLEATPEEYVANMVAVFREVRRVLKDDGTLWLNLGDSYAASSATTGGYSDKSTLAGFTGEHTKGRAMNRADNHRPIRHGLKPKDLIGMPWRLAFALQQPYYTGDIKDERDRIWLAAMLDAEGCLFVHKRKAGQSNGQGYERKNDNYAPGMEISNTHRAVVERVMQIAGKGSICTQEGGRFGRKQTLYRWNLRTTECKSVIRELYPYLIAKGQQARIAYGCPSSGEKAEAAHAALIGLHRGQETYVDFAAPSPLFEQGFYLRQDVIWSKSNPMPESVTDRCTKAHEYVFLLSKSPRYYFDAEAIAEKRTWQGQERTIFDNACKEDATPPGAAGHSESLRKFGTSENNPNTRNRRSVWTVPSQPYAEAHFATFPPKLIEPCILAGSRPGDVVLDPFFGSGTTGEVCERLGRQWLGVELSPEYAEMAARRTAQRGLGI